MDDDSNFFASPPPPSSDDVMMMGAPPPQEDDPIILGAPSTDDNNFFGGSDEPAPVYVGDVNETGDAPIVLGPPSTDEFGDELGGGGEQSLVTSSEPSPMQKWNNEWQETLKVRKEEENARRAELVEKARVDLELFLTEREQRRESKMAKNREEEQAKLEAIEADLENDNSWQKVCKMVELSHDSMKQAQDIKRMRDILILLKNNPAKAEALGA